MQDNLALYLAVVVVDGLNFENLSESCLSCDSLRLFFSLSTALCLCCSCWLLVEAAADVVVVVGFSVAATVGATGGLKPSRWRNRSASDFGLNVVVVVVVL